MRVRGMVVFCIVVVACFSMGARAEASVIIHEFLADPAPGLAGDANQDGLRHSSQDEFIELYNGSSFPQDMSGWTLSDSSSLRHVFPSLTILNPYNLLVVFSGGAPQLSDVNWQVASSGSLSLNNGGDSISLFNDVGEIIDFVVYGSDAGDDQSLVRNPEGSNSQWVKHALLDNANSALFSPGDFINEPLKENQGAVPEPLTIISTSLGLGWIVLMRKKDSVLKNV